MSIKKFTKFLVFLADLLAINLVLVFIFWLRYHSGFSPETYDPSRSFLRYIPLALILSFVGTGYFSLKGLYRDWSLHSRALQVAVVSRDVTLFCILVLAITTGSEYLDALRHHHLSNLFMFSRISIIFFYWIAILVSVNGLRLLAQMFIRSLLRIQSAQLYRITGIPKV